jgi:hypothetical protein
VQRWTYRTAIVEAEASGGLSLLRVMGIVTTDVLPVMFADVSAWHDETESLVHVADYRGAAMAVEVDVMLRAAGAVLRPPRTIANPTALVTLPEQEQFFRRYCAALSQSGVGRLVFTDYERALSWAWRIAALRAPPGTARSPQRTGNTPPRAPAQERARPSVRPARRPTGSGPA